MTATTEHFSEYGLRPDLTTPQGVRNAIVNVFLTTERNRLIDLNPNPEQDAKDLAQVNAVRILLALSILPAIQKVEALRAGLEGAAQYWYGLVGGYRDRNQNMPVNLFNYATWRVACITQATDVLNRKYK